MDNPKRARSGKPRTQPSEGAYGGPVDLPNAPERIRQAAAKDRQQPFASLCEVNGILDPGIRGFPTPSTTCGWENLSGIGSQRISPARILHPYPWKRLRVTTQGRSRMR